MLRNGNKRRVAVCLLSILLILEVHAADGQRSGSFRRSRPDIFRGLRRLFASLGSSIGGAFRSVRPKLAEEPAGKVSLVSEVNDCFRLGFNVAERLETWMKGHDIDGTRIKLYMRSRRMNERKLLAEEDLSDLEGIDFDIRRKTFFIIHGFMSTSWANWIPSMEDALLRLEDANVVSVDWSQNYMSMNYLKAVAATDNVGNQIATFLQDVSAAAAEKQGIPKDNWGRLHFIGHSLGSHISGFTAYQLKSRRAEWKIHRISGLDPAKPCFVKKVGKYLKLDSSDAPFVDVIHTDGDALVEGGISLNEPSGHFDFYPNGGKDQPGCSDVDLTNDLPYPIKVAKKVVAEATCNHGKSYVYFTESIVNSAAKNCTFWAQPWDLTEASAKRINRNACNAMNTCVEMGINSEAYYTGKSGAFYVPIAGNPPYCISD